MVLSGHDHDYERLLVGGLPYFVVGTGGASMYPFLSALPDSKSRYWSEHGAMLVTADDHSIEYDFYNVDGTLVDSYGNIKERIADVPEPGVAWWLAAAMVGVGVLRRSVTARSA